MRFIGYDNEGSKVGGVRLVIMRRKENEEEAEKASENKAETLSAKTRVNIGRVEGNEAV